MTKTLLTLFTLPFIAACAMPITQEDVDAASFGPEPLREEYMAIITPYFQEIALDPQSLILNCIKATKGWGRRYITDKPIFGWVVACDVNGRNSFGGFTGNQPYIFIFGERESLVLDPRDLEGAINLKVGAIK